MKIHFLGTAASEGIPNPFCRCEHCQQARIRKGKTFVHTLPRLLMINC